MSSNPLKKANVDDNITTISSARSGRYIARVKLEILVKDLQINRRVVFTIIHGFGVFWKKNLDTNHFVLAGSDHKEYFVRVASFPTERTYSGYLDIDSFVPSPVPIIAASDGKQKKRTSQPVSWLTHIYNRLFT